MRQFKKPDLNAPRYRPKVHNVLSPDLLKLFKEKYPKHKDIDYKTFKKVINKFSQNIWEAVIDMRDGIELPESLGYVFIGTCLNSGSKKPNIDYGKSIKYGVQVTNQNWESDGKLGKIFYTNYSVKYKVQDRQIWTFIPCRTFKRTVAKRYPEDWNKYVKIDNNLKISKLYTFRTFEHINKKLDDSKLETYNEFE
jgi:hypothetical protein